MDLMSSEVAPNIIEAAEKIKVRMEAYDPVALPFFLSSSAITAVSAMQSKIPKKQGTEKCFSRHAVHAAKILVSTT